MKYFDLHCDTLYEMFENNVGFFDNGRQVSLENAALFEKYARVCAIWTKAGMQNDEAYERYKKIRDHARASVAGNVAFCKSHAEILSAEKDGKIPLILAVEGASILGGDISRLNELYSDSVRFLTLVWKGSDIIGGAWDTDDGLTDFGKTVVSRCGELGIIVDVSHASRQTTRQALDVAEKCGAVVVATHSNSYKVCPHGRNLTDDEAKEIAARGGVIGLSLVPAHLCEGGGADVFDVLRHAEHFISLGLEKNVCIGADFDGIVVLPDGISGERDVKKIEAAFRGAGIPADVSEDIFWNNAARFVEKNM